MKFGEKTGQCESCDKEKTPIQHSLWLNGWSYESCWGCIAEIIIHGE